MTHTPTDIHRPAEPSGIRLVGTLALTGLLSGLAIVGAYELTLPIIEANNARSLERAVFEVVPGSAVMQGLVVEEGRVRPAGDGDAADVYAAYDEKGAFKGYAIPAEGAGFQDTIKLIYGYTPDRKMIVGMEVLESRETPGLGDKIYKDAAFVGNFSALSVEPAVVCVKHGEKSAANEVDAITGATISSEAVVRIIGDANGRWLGVLPAASDVPAVKVEKDPGAPPPPSRRDAASPVGDRGEQGEAQPEAPDQDGGHG